MPGFGGAVKLTGESEYKSAIQQITQNLRELSSEMKLVSSEYDANDRSMEATQAKAQALNNIYDEQTRKLETLKAQYEKFNAEAVKQSSEHEKLVNSYNAEKAKLDEIGRTLGTTSTEYQQQSKVVADLAEDVVKSTKAQDANEKSLSQMRTQINLAEADCNKTASAINNLGVETEETGKQAEEASKGWSIAREILADIAKRVINSAIDAMVSLGKAFVDVGKQALQSYSDFEQLSGGVKKLFGDETAQIVMDNAQKAFSSAGMSANQYMEAVTSFSARLLAGLGDDTVKAAEYADLAIRDMSDNANTFGTDISSIQAAYQGFAKGNYTMLDNLKLGFGGTKEEMARLVKESGILGEAGKDLTAKNLEEKVSFDQIIQALHITQERMGIAGTTSREAATTIEGSTKAMKAAWQNMLTGIADENADFETLTSNFIDSVVAMTKNIVPRITTILNGLSKALGTLVPQILETVVSMILDNLPAIVSAVEKIISSVIALAPKIMSAVSKLIPDIVRTLISMLPQVLDAGIKIVLELIKGLINAIPQLVASIPKLITSIVQTISKNFPQIIKVAVDLVVALAKGLIQAIPQLVKELPKIIAAIVKGLASGVAEMAKVGLNMVKGLWEGIKNAANWVLEKIKGFGQTILNGIKSFFGIHSPSTLFRDEIGENLAKGIGIGFEDEMKSVAREMESAIPSSFDTGVNVTGGTAGNAYFDMVNAFKQALSEMKIELDDEVAGAFVERTVSRAIFA